MPQFNAIRVSDKIEKVFIDFSSYESLKETSNFKKLYTIHTAETMEITHLLGFHVGGFCDDCGSSTNLLAGKISGYGTLPSDLILCLMDDHYEFLPLSEEQLDCLYIYLITGKVVDPNIDKTARKFFAKYKIYPVLPKLGTDCESFINKKHPNVLILKYDFDFNKIPENQISKIGEALFHYADHLIDAFKEMDDVYLSMGGDYFIKNLRDLDSGAYIVLIQARINKNERPVLNDVDIHNLVKDEEVIEDTIEEAQEDNEEAINDFIIFEVDAKWPNDPEKLTFSGQYIVPLNPPSDLKPSIPWFDQFFEIIGLDEINNKITIKIHEDDKEKTMDLPLNEKVIYDFNYYRDRSVERSLRIGRATFKYIKPCLTIDPIPGRIKVNTKYEVDGKLENNDNGYFEKIDYDEDVSGYVDNVLGDRYYILYTSMYDNLVILYGFSPDPDNDDENITNYYPLYLNNVSGNQTSYFDNEKKQTIMYSVTFSYEETPEDENDDECILKIHQSYSYCDTYDKYEDDSDYELEVKDGNSIKLKGGKYLTIKRINKKYHDATVYIGNSTNPEHCQFYVVDLKGRTANYKYSFNGGCNDSFHAESNIIEARLEKKWVRLD